MFEKNSITIVEFIVILIVTTFLFFQIDMVKYGVYIQSSSILIFTITAIIGILTYINQLDDRNKMMGVQYSSLTQSKMNEIDKMFMGNPALNRLYYEMYQDDPHIKKIIAISPAYQESPVILKAEHHASNIIFQTIADIYACNLINTSKDGIEWYWTFKQWMKSVILRSHWTYLKREHHPDVRKFINSLITN